VRWRLGAMPPKPLPESFIKIPMIIDTIIEVYHNAVESIFCKPALLSEQKLTVSV